MSLLPASGPAGEPLSPLREGPRDLPAGQPPLPAGETSPRALSPGPGSGGRGLRHHLFRAGHQTGAAGCGERVFPHEYKALIAMNTVSIVKEVKEELEMMNEEKNQENQKKESKFDISKLN